MSAVPFLLLALLLTLPFFLHLHLSVSITLDEMLTWQISASLLGLKKKFRFRMIRTMNGHEVQSISRSGLPHRIPPEKLNMSARKQHALALIKARKIRRYLLRHINDFEAEANVIIHTDNAAGTAMITGGIQVISNLVHALSDHITVRCSPGFSRTHTALHVKCIFSLRLGTLLITSAMMLLHGFRQQFQTHGR